jgi:hypothetical protein
VKTEVFLLPVSLSVRAAKKDFQSGKSMLALIICRYFYFSYAERRALTVNSIWFGREKKIMAPSPCGFSVGYDTQIKKTKNCPSKDFSIDS